MSPELQLLARLARPRSDSDWGSQRQVNAQNAFFVAVERNLSPELFAQLDNYCMKATTDEMIDEAIRLMGIAA